MVWLLGRTHSPHTTWHAVNRALLDDERSPRAPWRVIVCHNGEHRCRDNFSRSRGSTITSQTSFLLALPPTPFTAVPGLSETFAPTLRAALDPMGAMKDHKPAMKCLWRARRW